MDKNKKDYLVSTLVYQFVFCVLLIAICFFLSKSSSTVFDAIKDEFSAKIEDNSIFTEALETFKNQIQNETEDLPTQPTEAVTEVVADNSKKTETKTVNRTVNEIADKPETPDIPVNASMNGYVFNQIMQRPVSGEITSEFGFREHPVYGGERFHTGLDIGADEGTPIKAAFDGTVSFVGSDDSFGNYIEISHGSNIKTLYCHLQSVYADKNDLVEAGQTIGFVGQTGVATGPHLHFEIRINGVSYDPYIAYINSADEI